MSTYIVPPRVPASRRAPFEGEHPIVYSFGPTTPCLVS